MNIIHRHKSEHTHRHQNFMVKILDSHTAKESKYIRHAVTIGCVVNLFLMLLKLSFGYLGNSEALIADGYHSLGDLASDILMLAFVGVSFKEVSKKFPYGYGKFETFVALLISLILVSISTIILKNGLMTIIEYSKGETIERPDIWTILAIIIAISCKEMLFRYYRYVGKKTRCRALISSGWHHRTDALSSIATLLGVSGAYFLGEHWRILDPIVSILIGIIILVSAFRIFIPCFFELMEISLSNDKLDKVEKIIMEIKNVISIKSIKSRKSGPFYLFDIDINVGANTTVAQTSEIFEEIKNNLNKEFGQNIHVNIVASPA